jgi:hypothetical protein
MKTKIKKTLYTLIAMIGFANFTMAQVPSYVPTNGLVAWYPFTGNANDASGNGNNGTNNGATLTSDRFGNNNKAYSFDGNDWIRTVSDFDQASRTICAWFKIEAYSNSIMEIINNDNSQLNNGHTIFSILSNNTLNLQSGTGGVRVNPPVINSWYFVSVTRDNVSTKYYVNGQILQVDQNGNMKSNNSISQNLRIGVSRVDENYFVGQIDDIGIWNRALTQQEITALYTAIDCIDTITKQPTNQMVNINTNASFIVATTDSLATYQWQTDVGMGFQNISSAGQFNGATNDTLIVSNTSMTNNNQNFRCIVSSGTCKDTSTTAKLTVNNSTGINSPSNVNALKVYPNPASTILHIDLEKPGYYTAKLSSVAGQSIISPTTGTVDISALANGVYILTIYDSNNQLISTNKVSILK